MSIRQLLQLLFGFGRGRFVLVGPLSQARSFHTEALLQDGRVLIAGGFSSHSSPSTLSSCELFEPGTRSFVAGNAMSTQRAGHRATLLTDGRVFVTGGWRYTATGRIPQDSTEFFDPISGAWTNGPTMNYPRVLHSATRLPDGRVLLAGGLKGDESNGDTIFERHAQIYNPASNTFTAVNRAPDNEPMGYTAPLEQRWRHTAVLTPDGTGIWLDGGYMRLSDFHFGAVSELYDIALNRFVRGGAATGLSAPASRAGHTTIFPTGIDHRVLIGGTSHTGGQNAMDADCAFSGGSEHTNLRTRRTDHTATQLPNGSILVAGGFNGSVEFPILSAAELLSFETQTEGWHRHPGTSAPAGNMNVPRTQHTATLLNNGDVLLVGGLTYGETGTRQSRALTNSAEIYEPFVLGARLKAILWRRSSG